MIVLPTGAIVALIIVAVLLILMLIILLVRLEGLGRMIFVEKRCLGLLSLSKM